MLRPGQKIGKYKLKARLSNGPYATVFRALDTLEGVHVALKIPHKGLVTKESLDDFSREVRLAAKLDHPNILRLKTADFIDGHLVIALPLGEESLEDRLARRLSLRTALDLGEQLLRAVAFAHEQHVIHCDVKPDNLLLFPDGRLRLTDFGISKIAHRTISASGAGTVGYMAPSKRWAGRRGGRTCSPPGSCCGRCFPADCRNGRSNGRSPGYDTVADGVASGHDRAAQALARNEAEPAVRGRRPNAGRLPAREAQGAAPLRAHAPAEESEDAPPSAHWKEIRQQQFQRQFGRQLETHFKCGRCDGPVSEFMHGLPVVRRRAQSASATKRRSPPAARAATAARSSIGTTAPGATAPASRMHPSASTPIAATSPAAAIAKCDRKDLMPFMRYCPWCHTKVRQPWKIAGSNDTCRKCGWGVLRDFWTHCPWCAAELYT